MFHEIGHRIGNSLSILLFQRHLHESEEKYKSLLKNINMGIYRNTVGSKGEFIGTNPAIVEMYGLESKGF